MKKRSYKLKEGKNKQTLKLVRTKADDPVDDGPFLTKEEFHKQLNLLEINRLKALEKIEVNQSDVDPESINIRQGYLLSQSKKVIEELKKNTHNNESSN
ncbi:unnamed protein product [Rhizophagus irregularis]|uniref:Uncharacterized protein n=1 Tax=Rhizophagus irregularis TaxID=588596 RepID=A0A915Z5U8_9GLOM|nr:unnamed protein product [Rhizophagus irregularis]CAB5362553.1 unnamed protein product [Rhizophagus irregularis]